MKTDNRSPFTMGMEIEQFPGAVPDEVRNYTMNNDEGSLDGWHNDASGPRETTLGPYKQAKAILNRFYTDTRDEEITWDWHSTDGSRGAGSHVHLNVAEEIFDEPIDAWTIAYNTSVELFPFLAPFFCHNWEQGFRNGTNYSAGTLNVDRWAEGQLTRLATDSVRDRVENARTYRREYQSVTFNGARDNGKPLTIEFRANDAHPAMALPGMLTLRRLTGRAMERGWSVKLDNHRQTLRRCYNQIYARASEVGLITAMKEPIEGGITFEENRGIPGVDQREFDTMWEVLRKILAGCILGNGTWTARANALVATGVDECGPQRNTDALWHTDADDFDWDHGPADAPDDASDPTALADTGAARTWAENRDATERVVTA